MKNECRGEKRGQVGRGTANFIMQQTQEESELSNETQTRCNAWKRICGARVGVFQRLAVNNVTSVELSRRTAKIRSQIASKRYKALLLLFYV